MRFSELVDQAVEFLRQRERVSYRALKREFELDDETLEDLKAELVDARRIARDEDGKVLAWVGGRPESVEQEKTSQEPISHGSSHCFLTRTLWRRYGFLSVYRCYPRAGCA
jgi:hypothetical protein